MADPSPMPRRLRLTLAYDGTAYHGWQVQPDRSTIQATLQDVLTQIEGAPVNLDASGRTDAGVHALAQVAACTLQNPIPGPNLVKAMNRLLPRDIRVLDAVEAPLDFHPRFQARAKTYEYRILRTPICPPFERDYVLHYPYPLNEDPMFAAAPVFVGEHDFTAFAAADPKDALGRSKIRQIFHATLTRDGDLLRFQVRGSGFLKHMVRNMVGVLLEIGKNNICINDLRTRLTPNCRIPAGPTAPACGLFLLSVEYH